MISASGGLQPQWSADGKRLFYLSLNGDLIAVDVRDGASFQSSAPQRMFGGVSTSLTWNVSPDGDRFLFLRWGVLAGPPPPFTLVLNWMAKLEQ
jgi:Tol biopolymer transport system component